MFLRWKRKRKVIIKQPRFVQNLSRKFESRWVTVRILDSPSIMLKGMANSILGIWVAHGEGKLYFPDQALKNVVRAENLVPMVYVDDEGWSAEEYPFNPNGSSNGWAGLCTEDGRHLAMMPHPERTFKKWQWSWMSEAIRATLKESPWFQMFLNAREWCDSVK
jgi:phosphoribosylformylglycinamidine synthase